MEDNTPPLVDGNYHFRANSLVNGEIVNYNEMLRFFNLGT